MKITMNVECTPEEARAFLGLPDLKPMQDRLIKDIEEQMAARLKAMSPEEMMKAWMPAAKGLEQMQAFFSQMAGAAREK